MRENRIDWTRFWVIACVLSLAIGGYWLFFQTKLTENWIGRAIVLAGGILFVFSGIFGLLRKPRSLVPLLDFFALAASLAAMWQVAIQWQELAGVAVSMLYLLSCNASTIVGDGDRVEEPDYSELHPYWENMENIKKQFEERDRKKEMEEHRNEQ